MENTQSGLLIERLADMCIQMSGDFCGFARFNRQQNRIYWAAITGAVSDRHEQLAIKPGVGLLGQTIRHGRPFLIDSSTLEIEQERHNNPIMLMERLACALAVPVWQEDAVIGVLLIGNRTLKKYKSQEIQSAQQFASALFIEE